MYLKIMLRGLLRHRKSGIRLFILLVLSCQALMFTIAFRDSFNIRYSQLGVDFATADLQVLPKDSPKTGDRALWNHREGLALMDYSPELRSFLNTEPGVELTMPLLETGAALFTLDGEETGWQLPLIGVDPVQFKQMLPAVRVLEGKDELAWHKGMAEVPVFRPKPQDWETRNINDRFERINFRAQGPDWERFKQKIVAEYPKLFEGVETSGFAGAAGDTAFLAAMTGTLEMKDLPDRAAQKPDAPYDYHVDDALVALQDAQTSSTGSETEIRQLRVLRKRYLQTLMPEDITPVFDVASINTSYSLLLPPAKSDDLLARPAIMPSRLIANVDRMPLFYMNFYADAEAVRNYLSIAPDQYTSIMIRLKPGSDPIKIRQDIADWLTAHGRDEVVLNKGDLGKLFLSTALAFSIVTLVVIVLFASTIVIFVANTVSLSLVKRRREIGTSIALGFAPAQNRLVIAGETMFLVFFAWLLAALIGTTLELWMQSTGLPGLIFFPDGRLFFVYNPVHALQSLLIVFVVSLFATLWPMRKMGRLKVVDLLKEAA